MMVQFIIPNLVYKGITAVCRVPISTRAVGNCEATADVGSQVALGM